MNAFDAVDILLVEDNPHDAELTMLALRQYNLANRFFTVKDGGEALDFIFGQGQYASRQTANLPKVVLLDLKLPKLTGLEVLEAIRANEATRLLPVVMVTSSAEDPDIQSAYNLGVNSYVVKPVEFDAFQEAVNRLGFYWLLINKPAN